MCTFCGQHCVEDEPYRLSPEEIKTGKRVPENTCPDKQKDGVVKTKSDPNPEIIPLWDEDEDGNELGGEA